MVSQLEGGVEQCRVSCDGLGPSSEMGTRLSGAKPSSEAEVSWWAPAPRARRRFARGALRPTVCLGR
jgi:hypothetical protein